MHGRITVTPGQQWVHVLQATMRLLQASIKDLLPEVLGNDSCTDFAIQPDTIDGMRHCLF